MASTPVTSKRSMPAAKTLLDAVDRLAPTLKAREELYDLISAFHEAVVEDFRDALATAKAAVTARRART